MSKEVSKDSKWGFEDEDAGGTVQAVPDIEPAVKSTAVSQIEAASVALSRELGKLRTGRASAGMLDHTIVETCGAKMPLNHVAVVSVLDSMTLSVTPYDPAATLSLAIEILLLEENGLVDTRQEIGHLINAIVAVLGPELSPGSIFFCRYKAVIAEVCSCQETSTLLESVRFTQQLVLFAPQAVSVHAHIQSLLPTLSLKQPSLRYLAVSTLRHLIEKDPVAMIREKIEESLFSMLDEETDSEHMRFDKGSCCTWLIKEVVAPMTP